jgi:hypothetical protein
VRAAVRLDRSSLALASSATALLIAPSSRRSCESANATALRLRWTASSMICWCAFGPGGAARSGDRSIASISSQHGLAVCLLQLATWYTAI